MSADIAVNPPTDQVFVVIEPALGGGTQREIVAGEGQS